MTWVCIWECVCTYVGLDIVKFLKTGQILTQFLERSASPFVVKNRMRNSPSMAAVFELISLRTMSYYDIIYAEKFRSSHLTFLRILRGNLNGYLRPVKLVDVTITVYRKLSTAELRQLLTTAYTGL